jgi:hypothetical protein
MAHFIRDVRKDFNAAKLPVVIGQFGVGGTDPSPNGKRPPPAMGHRHDRALARCARDEHDRLLARPQAAAAGSCLKYFSSCA